MSKAIAWTLAALTAAGTLIGCGSESQPGAAQAAEASDPDVERVLELYDAAAQAVGEVSNATQAERACVTLKALGLELVAAEKRLAEKGVAISDFPNALERLQDARQRLSNALSALTVKDPESARVITVTLGGSKFQF